MSEINLLGLDDELLHKSSDMQKVFEIANQGLTTLWKRSAAGDRGRDAEVHVGIEI
jgi:hypothetical protein